MQHTSDLPSDESDLSISDENRLLLESQSGETDDEEALDFNSDDDQWHSKMRICLKTRFYIRVYHIHVYVSSYVSIMLFVMKHSLTKESFSDLLALIQTHLPKDTKFTTSVYHLKEILKKNIGFEDPMKYYYCDTCDVSLEVGSQCSKESCRSLNSKLLMFHDLRNNLLDFLKVNSFFTFCLNLVALPTPCQRPRHTVFVLSVHLSVCSSGHPDQMDRWIYGVLWSINS